MLRCQPKDLLSNLLFLTGWRSNATQTLQERKTGTHSRFGYIIVTIYIESKLLVDFSI